MVSEFDLKERLRRRVYESGKKDNYYLSVDEYHAGKQYDIFKEIQSAPQGSGVVAVTVECEGVKFISSVSGKDL